MKLLVLDGDGIGPEIVGASLAVLDAAEARFGLKTQRLHRDIGLKALGTQGTTFPDDLLPLARGMDGIVLGPMSNLDYPPRDKGASTSRPGSASGWISMPTSAPRAPAPACPTAAPTWTW